MHGLYDVSTGDDEEHTCKALISDVWNLRARGSELRLVHPLCQVFGEKKYFQNSELFRNCRTISAVPAYTS